MKPLLFVYDDIFLEHDTGRHPENKNRLISINSGLEKPEIKGSIARVKPQKADIASIRRIHTGKYIEHAEDIISSGHSFLDSPDTVVSGKSMEAALYAAGSGITAADKIMKEGFETAFCALRPPGHHAEKELSMGFCIFNNVAITARYLQEVYNLEKILILDWDVHHGNGTEHSFYDDSSVFYISLHQYPHYPGSGALGDTGVGEGDGYNKNYPMSAGTGDKEYLERFREIKAIIKGYKPDFILLSSGFDAHTRDPLSSIQLSSEVFGTFTEIVKSASGSASGRVISFLEGGYDLEALKEAIEYHLKALHK